jgi:hypothetical protein
VCERCRTSLKLFESPGNFSYNLHVQIDSLSVHNRNSSRFKFQYYAFHIHSRELTILKFDRDGSERKVVQPRRTEPHGCDVGSSSTGSWLSCIVIKASAIHVLGWASAEHMRIILRVLDWNKRLQNVKVIIFRDIDPFYFDREMQYSMGTCCPHIYCRRELKPYILKTNN